MNLGSGTLDHPTIHAWNHGLGEVIDALITAGLHIDLVDRVPLMYSILATKV